jgi:iterative type I PKS product template protein
MQITGGVRAFGPGRINYHFGFSGPSFSVDTACSSSMAAIQLACTSLRAGDCDTVFTGGMNVLTNPDIFSGLSKGQFLSKTGSCKTYDEGADGYCRGDGVVTLILKRLGDALIDKDPILGVIAGIATNHSAEAVSITHPHIGAQEFLFQKVMDEATVDIRDVRYVEMHGTGTQAGDGVEMSSVSSVFAPSKKKRRPDQPIFVGSVKANIGHGEAVSGACAVVKVMLMFQKNMIPPHCGIKTRINQGFPSDLKDRNLHIAFTPTPFPRSGESPRYVFMNNFSAAGGNTATLLEDAPSQPSLALDPRSSHVVVVSAKSHWSFKQNIQRLLKWIYDQPDAVLPSLAYTTTARRAHHNYRVAIEATDLKHLHQSLSSLAESARTPLSSTRPHVAFAFTGQGSHYIGMGQKLFQDVEQFRQDIEDYDQIARNQGFPAFMGLINGSIKDLASASPVVTQLAVVCNEIALARLWRSWGVVPSVVVGHSLGEYAALHVAGVLSIFDTICLVGRRAQIMVSTCAVGSHGMLAVRGSLSSIAPLISDISVEPACINGPEETVFSGTVDQIEKLKEILTAHEIKSMMLNVPYAFHSAQVDPILDAYVASAKSAVFQKPQIPIISTLMGSVVSESGTFSAEYLARHCREKVDFLGGLNAALETELVNEHTAWVEVGPHPICSNMIKSTLGKDVIAVPSLHRSGDDWKTAATSLSVLFNAGVDIDWSGYHHDFEDAHKVLPMPSYAFDEKTYWIDYKMNWCLTKGDTPAPALLKPTFSTTSIHRIIDEKFGSTSALVIGQSDLSDPLLRAVIEGHIVNGVRLCPSSLYADMALTICDYAYRGAKPETADIHINVGNMETHKPLILNVDSSSGVQLLQIEAKLDLTQARAIVSYRSVSADGNPIDQARCEVTFEDSATWSKEWERRKFLVEGRLDILKAGGKGIHHVQRGLAYKLFSALVQYADRYRGMEEVTLFSEGLEATAQIQLQATSKDGNFFMSPYFIDSVAHISGFIMNANDAVDSKKQVYISHGWESMRFAKNLDPAKRYVSYVKMQQVAGAGKMVAGDVYVFEGDEIIGVVGGVRFQCVPRALLDTLLTSKSTTTAFRPVAAPPPQMKQPNTTKVDTKIRKTQTPTKTVVTKEIGLATKALIKVSSVLTEQALMIIANEVGCDISELADSIVFTDIGVDSLMSLSISGRFREELEIEFHSTAFNDMPTVGHLKEFLKQFETQPSTESSRMTTPDIVSSDSSYSEDSIGPPEPMVEDSYTPENEDLVRIIRSTIAEEMGVELEEISDNTDLATMGMDSLMSLSILGALREKTGLSMQSDLLVHNTCVEKIETSLGLRTVKTARGVTKNGAKTATKSSVSSSNKSCVSTSTTGKINLSSYPPAQSILLQGNPKTATHALFFLPDGSGSATSYTTIPDIAPSLLCVYGLNCPFMKDPESFTIGVAGVTQIYMAEIQRRQPTGPYLLGGWSAGGVLAYEMTRQFLQKGEAVSKLLLIDSPCPLGLEALPSSFHRFCDSIGLLGKGDKSKIPSWLLPHFASSVRELTSYSETLDNIVDEIDVTKMPTTTAIWARDGIVKNVTDPKPEWDPRERMPNSMHWLVNNRKDLGSNGWERLVGKHNIKCTSTTGNHFTMMREPIVSLELTLGCILFTNDCADK